MLTDDDLTSQLRSGFDASTHDLTYGGRRRPRRTAPVVLPLAAASLTFGVVAVNGLLGQERPSPPAAVATTPSAIASAAPRLVTHKIQLAGFTVEYQAREGEPAPLYAVSDAKLPRAALRVRLSELSAKLHGSQAWTGKYPATGANALYLRSASRNDGKLFALVSSTMTQKQLLDVVRTDTPRAVPLVER